MRKNTKYYSLVDEIEMGATGNNAVYCVNGSGWFWNGCRCTYTL